MGLVESTACSWAGSKDARIGRQEVSAYVSRAIIAFRRYRQGLGELRNSDQTVIH